MRKQNYPVIVGIYKITSPSNKVYIGQSWNILNRWTAYKRIRKVHKHYAIEKSLVKYGYNAHKFEIAHELPKDIESDILTKYEQLYIDFYKSIGIYLLNIRDAGSIGKHSDSTKKKMSEKATGKKHTEETIKKISLAKKGKPSGRKGCKCSPEHIEKSRKANTGKKHTEAAKKKISLNSGKWNKGKPISDIAKEKNRIAHLGKKMSEETKSKMSESAKRVIKTPEHNKKVSQSLRAYFQKKKNQLPLFNDL